MKLEGITKLPGQRHGHRSREVAARAWDSTEMSYRTCPARQPGPPTLESQVNHHDPWKPEQCSVCRCLLHCSRGDVDHEDVCDETQANFWILLEYSFLNCLVSLQGHDFALQVVLMLSNA